MFESLLGLGESQPLVFLGEVSGTDFITNAELTAQHQFSAGTSFNPNASWLKFNDKGRIKYLAKVPLRHSISYQQIAAAGGATLTKVVDVKGKQYICRLMTGTDLERSEWDRLINSIAADRVARYTGEKFADFSKVALGMQDTDLGRYTFCQLSGSNAIRRIVAQDTLSPVAQGTVFNYQGWRPILEEI